MAIAPAYAVAQDGAAAPSPKPRTEIVVDEKASVIRFIVDGEERARIDADGMHVEGDLTYAGTIKDTGQTGASAAVMP